MARINQGPIEKLVVYDPASSVKPHVHDKERRHALLVVDILYELPTRDIVRLF